MGVCLTVETATSAKSFWKAMNKEFPHVYHYHHYQYHESLIEGPQNRRHSHTLIMSPSPWPKGSYVLEKTRFN